MSQARANNASALAGLGMSVFQMAGGFDAFGSSTKPDLTAGIQ
jgi:shikimate 5-dehydrogenase